MQSPKILFLGLWKKGTNHYGSSITRSYVSPYRSLTAYFRNFEASFRHGTVFVPKQYLHQKETLGMQSPKILFLGWCKKGINPNWASKYPHSCIAIRGRQCKFPKFRGFLSPWYRVCTKAIFSSTGSFRDAEPKNFILGLVQIGYKPLRGFKVPAFMCRDIGRECKFTKFLGFLSPWYRACTKTIFISIGMQSSRILSLGWCK